MTKRSAPIFGVIAPHPRPTLGGAIWVGVLVSVPIGALLFGFEAALRLWL